MSISTPPRAETSAPTLGYLAGIGTVFGLEIRQRLRNRGWYIMLGIWFVVVAAVVGLAALSAGTEAFGTGQVMFELVISFVLFFGVLIAPALSANSITGDRANGTLAILQNTLLTSGQLLWGKWLASWAASLGFLVVTLPLIGWAMAYGDVYLPAAPVLLGMLALQLAIVCALGVGVSALANRTLFAVMVTYLLVAFLGIGTVIAYGLSMQLVRTEVQVSNQVYSETTLDGAFTGVSDESNYTCETQTYAQEAFSTDRITWLLAANPFVVVADAAPQAVASQDPSAFAPSGPMGAISSGVRYSQAGPAYQMPCLNGVKNTDLPPAPAPLWPLGLGLQVLLAGGILVAGRYKLKTPAGRLASGTRIA